MVNSLANEKECMEFGVRSLTRGIVPEAQFWFEKAIEKGASIAEPHIYLGRCHAVRLDITEARKQFEYGRNINGDNHEADYWLKLLEDRSHLIKSHPDLFRRTFLTDKDDPNGHFSLLSEFQKRGLDREMQTEMEVASKTDVSILDTPRACQALALDYLERKNSDILHQYSGFHKTYEKLKAGRDITILIDNVSDIFEFGSEIFTESSEGPHESARTNYLLDFNIIYELMHPTEDTGTASYIHRAGENPFHILENYERIIEPYAKDIEFRLSDAIVKLFNRRRHESDSSFIDDYTAGSFFDLLNTSRPDMPRNNGSAMDGVHNISPDLLKRFNTKSLDLAQV